MRSDSSHQAFLRAYMIGADGKIHSTGALLTGNVTTDAGTGNTHDDMADMGPVEDQRRVPRPQDHRL